MKIANKISILVIFLLTAMAVNVLIGLTYLSKVGHELENVALRDTVLTEQITLINQYQLERAILLERLIRVAEELAFEEVGEARRQHLMDYIGIVNKGFNELSQKGAEKIIDARKIINDAFHEHEDSLELAQIQNSIKSIEQAHIGYGASVNKLIELISLQQHQISFDDLDHLRADEKKLSQQIKDLLMKVQLLVRGSLTRANITEITVHKILINNLWVSILLGVIVAFSIIRNISTPLNSLVQAAKQLGQGNFNFGSLKKSHDEIGELSTAFEDMSQKLEQAKKKLEESLRITENQKDDLQKVNKELDSFVHTVSHDIRSPLTGIINYSLLLQKNYANVLDERAIKSLQGIYNGGMRLDQMINDLLNLTKITRVKNPFEMVNMDDLIDSVLDRLEYKIEEHKVDVKIDDHMPNVYCDKIKMAEVFLNLISNAIKFSAKSGPKIEIGFKELNNYYQFLVKDNGVGVDPKFHQSIFEIFQRAQDHKEFEGTGVGLSIVKRVIEDHQGKIWVESQPSQGATFYFTISKALSHNQSVATF